jgi:hypothetical protein
MDLWVVPGEIILEKDHFHIRVRNQVAVLLKVMRDTDHGIMPFDHKAVISAHVKAYMEIGLSLELFKHFVRSQQMLDRGLKESGHWFLHND